jgi:S1-C subfamily serine protease
MPQITLTRLTGFDRNKKSSFDRDSITLGTDAGCDVRFDPTWDKSVSGQHLTLENRQGSWWAKDASKDGTYLSGRKINLEKLSPGAVLELGKGGPKIQVDFAAAAAPAPSGPSTQPRTVSTPVATAEPPPMAAAAPAATPAGAAPRPASSSNAGLIIALVVVFFVGSLGALGWYFRDKLPFFSKASDQALAEVAKEYAQAVGVVTIVHPTINDGKPDPFGTAWAVGPRVFATNSHVTEDIPKMLKEGVAVYVVINRTTDKRLRVTRAVVHPKYGKDEINFEGKPHALRGIGYDVGLLFVDEDAPKVLKIAPRAELEKLDAGYRVGYMGFPMEGIAGGGVEVRSPVATMQSGIITANTDYWLAQATFEKRFLVHHNMGSTGGASGSPLFNDKGQVVAILNAGNIIGQAKMIQGEIKIVRAPSGALINYAQRVDLLRDIWPDYPKE